MTPARTAPRTIDGYIDRFPPDVQAMLQRIRQTIHDAGPKGNLQFPLDRRLP
jgi:hypothetical protein